MSFSLSWLALARGLVALVCCIVMTGWQTMRAAEPAAEVRPRDWANQTTLKSGWQFARGDVGGVWETVRSKGRSLDWPGWSAVTLPHCFNAADAVDPEVTYYQGPAWYRTTLDIANPYSGGRTLLHFEGVGQKAEVYVGDQRVARHVGGYDEWVVDITEAVAAWRASPLAKLGPAESAVPAGRVPVAVRADNSRDLEMIPSDLSDFNLYGGIYRPVHLVYLPAEGLTRVQVTPVRQADGAWQVAVQARFAAAAAGAEASDQAVTVRLLDPQGEVVGQVDRSITGSPDLQAVAAFAVPAANAQLWSPATPHLYGVEVTAKGTDGESRVRTRTGLRSFEFVEHGPFKLNGERLLLRGTHRHEDHAGLGAAMTQDLIEQEMRLMKTMGVNFIRLGHYQQSRRVLELCDELGIVVWEEIPWCRGGLGGDGYRDQARAMLRAMIDQHRNHPSVVLWGLGNENDWPGDFSAFDQDAIRGFMQELHDLAHALDPTRVTAIRRCDFCKDIVDVYSPSIWAGWYRGQFSEYREVSEKEMRQVKHFLHVEWGGDSHAGRHAEDPYATLRDVAVAGAADERGLDFLSVGGDARASRDGDWSETYICDVVDWHLKEQENMDWLTGAAMWPFKDFSTPLRPENPVPYVNQKGAVERDLTPKESFYVYQSYWTTEPMVHVYGHSWPVRWGGAEEKRWLKVYSNCDEVELWLNGQSLGKRQRNSQDFPAAGLRWSAVFEAGMNTVRAVGTKNGIERVDELSFRYETRPWGPPDHLRMQADVQADGRVRVAVELLDAAGVVCLDSRALVRFDHAGDGRLIDNLGTAGAARHVQLANGRARIDVDLAGLSEGARGMVSAQVDLPGVPTAMISVALPPATPAVASAAAGQELKVIERERVQRLAAVARTLDPISLRSVPLPDHAVAAGVQPGDFFSMGDYWWPNPATADGLPYVRRDGESNPENFEAHRLMLRQMREAVATSATNYLITGETGDAQRAAEWLRVFFVDPATRMNPHLRFAQAIPGITPGRGIGIIDTLHLAEVARAAAAIASAPGVSAETLAGVRQWFRDYLQWMRTSPNGREEAATKNNHSVAYWLQVAVFARLVGDEAALAQARETFATVLLPMQLALDGSFPRELERTKPYGYSIFQLDNVALLAEVLSTPERDLWTEALPDGRSVGRAVAFLYPYLADRDAWSFARDVAHFEAWPVRQPALFLAGYRLGRPAYLKLWRSLEADPKNLKVRRNMAVTQPLLWVADRAGR